jgi:hypothetical protein
MRDSQLKPDEAVAQRVAAFALERQEIWWRRKMVGAKPPWTTDPILQEHRFTNVYRELDPGTGFAISRILQAEGRSRWDKLFNLMVYRMIGKEVTWERIGFLEAASFKPVQMVKPMQALRDEGEAPFTEAYMVYPCHLVEGGTGDKVVDTALAVHALAQSWPDTVCRLSSAVSRSQAHEALSAPYGWGQFLGFQVLVDACYPFVQPGTGPDPVGPIIREGTERLLPFSNEGWAAFGPGALRGLGRVFPGLRKPLHQVAVQWLVWFLRDAMPGPMLTRVSSDGSTGPYELDASNVCNVLCEFDKYERYRAEGRAGRGRLFAAPEAWKADRIARGYGKQLDLIP